MEVLIDDMKRAFGTEQVCFPGAQDDNDHPRVVNLPPPPSTVTEKEVETLTRKAKALGLDNPPEKTAADVNPSAKVPAPILDGAGELFQVNDEKSGFEIPDISELKRIEPVLKARAPVVGGT